MLDEKDLQILQSLFEQSEARMSAKIDGVETRLNARIDGVETRLNARIDDVETRLNARIDDVETRLTAKIDDVETRMTAKIDNVETRMTSRIEERVEDTRSMIMAYLETAIEPKLRMLAEGHQSLFEGKASNERVDRLEEELSTARSLIMVLGDEVSELKKAQ